MSESHASQYLLTRPWRVGRKIGRTIYAVVGVEASDDDVLIGMMDTRQLAAAAVRHHNAALVKAFPDG